MSRDALHSNNHVLFMHNTSSDITATLLNTSSRSNARIEDLPPIEAPSPSAALDICGNGILCLVSTLDDPKNSG